MIRPTGKARGTGRVFGSKLYRAAMGTPALRPPQDEFFLLESSVYLMLTSAPAGPRQPAELREASPSR
jgi:hypothetical protein